MSHSRIDRFALNIRFFVVVVYLRMRLRKKNGKKPGAILLDSEVFGTDIFVNAMTELCIEILDGI